MKETFIVDDPGFHKGLDDFPDTYQMRVHAELEDGSREQQGKTVININGSTIAALNLGTVMGDMNATALRGNDQGIDRQMGTKRRKTAPSAERELKRALIRSTR